MKTNCLIIDLPRLKDRRANLLSWLPESWDTKFLSDLGLSWDHQDADKPFPAIRSPIVWQIPSDNPWWSRPLLRGEIACSLAHDEAWKVASENADFTLILEDDAHGYPDIEMRLAEMIEKVTRIDPQWDLLYCGRVAMDVDQRFCCENIVVPGYSHCTYAYAVSQAGGQKLVKNDIRNHMMPVDEFLPAMYCAHPRADVKAIPFVRLLAYAVQPEIISQRHKSLFGSETENSAVKNLNFELCTS